MSVRDVKGYYASLGVSPDADADTIRRAYRSKVKQLHPDSGGASADADAFQTVNAAYTVLRDPERRAAYDDLNATIDQAEKEKQRQREAQAAAAAAAAAKTRARSSRAKTTAHDTKPGPEPPPKAQAKPQTGEAKPSPVFAAVHCDRCGRIPAQPRYLIFEQVIGMIWRSRRTEIAGAFCRRCADITAVKASLITWLLGWWSIVPFGPYRAIRAIVRNLAGGMRPPERNARLLARQARAFYGMGRSDIAGTLAMQAYAMKPDPEVRRIIELTDAVRKPLRLKDRWQLGGWGFLVQAMPIGLIIALVIVETAALGAWVARNGASWLEATTSSESPAPPMTVADHATMPDAEADLRFVMVESAKVREGPDESLAVVATVRQGDTVEVVGDVVAGGWVPVKTTDGLWGHLPADVLTPGKAARFAWCRDGVGPRPATGSIFAQAATGDHRLAIVNRGATDAVVKLRDPGEHTVLTVFVRSNSKVEVERVPDGAYAVDYATGTGFSPRCGIFVDEMEAWRYPDALTFGPAAPPADRRVPRQMALGDAGPAGSPRPLSPERFTVD
ncbi:MAG: hypothetical protein CMM50_04140 [Rhodospirillaceae bacterium]|nr:hypothetical protein [Rhodospirillaceae bacterium]